MPRPSKQQVVYVQPPKKKVVRRAPRNGTTMVVYREPRSTYAKYASGDYIRTAASLSGAAIGGALGGPIGAPIGAALGGSLGHLIHSFTGMGKVKKNTLLSSREYAQGSFGDGSVRVNRREFLGNVLGTSGFVNNSYIVNPTDANTFPWLSTIATNFEQYKPHGVMFEYRSMSSDSQVGSTVSLGQVLLATEYNVLANRFVTPEEMLNSQWSESVKPSNNCGHYIECAKGMTPNTPLYCRDPSDGGVSDARLYDLANFQIATQGMPSSGDGQIIGQLYIIYDIELMKPVLSDNSLITSFDHKYQSQFTGDVLGTNLFGAAPARWNVASSNDLGVVVIPATNTVSFSPKNPENVDAILCKYQLNYNTPLTVPIAGIAISTSNCTIENISYGLGGGQMSSDLLNSVVFFYISPLDRTLPFSYTFTGSSDSVISASFDLYHTLINPNLNNIIVP